MHFREQTMKLCMILFRRDPSLTTIDARLSSHLVLGILPCVQKPRLLLGSLGEIGSCKDGECSCGSPSETRGEDLLSGQGGSAGSGDDP